MDNHRDFARYTSQRPEVQFGLEAALRLALLIAPLAIGLVWGTHFDDSAYASFHHARNLAAGRGLTDPATAGGQPLLRSPLYMLALALPAGLGLPLPQAGLILSGLGWGVTAVAIYSAGRAMRRPVAAVVSATLVACSPVVVSTLGTEISWTLAWAWIAVASAIRKRWGIQAAALALMLGTHFDLSTLAVAALLSIVQWIEGRRFPVWPSLVLAIAALGWGLLAGQQAVAPFPMPRLSLAEWVRTVRQLLDESEFYWLFLPLMGMGVLTVTRKALWGGLLWGTISVLSGGAAAAAAVATLGLFLAGLGVEWLVKWIETRNAVRLSRLALAVSLALVAGLPLGIAHASSLLQRYPFRPIIQQELEGQVADWLRVHSERTAIVLGSARIGYLADRATYPWDGVTSDPAGLADLVKTLDAAPPGYCVSFRSIAWDRLARTDWFQDGYAPLQKFESPYDAASPFTIWGYRFQGAAKPVGANFANQINLLSFRAPDRLSPGAEFDVRLYWEVVQPPGCHSERSEESRPPGRHSERSEESRPPGCHSECSEESRPPGRHSERSEESRPPGRHSERSEESRQPGCHSERSEESRPLEENYTVFIHLMDADGQLVANHNEMRLTRLWPPGEVTPDVHHIVPDPPIPAGTYRLLMGMYHWPSIERLPVWDKDGVQLADSLVVLQSIEVR